MSRQQVHQVQVYTDAEGRFRWRFVHANGRVLSDSGQGYSRRIDCLRGLSVACDVPAEIGASVIRVGDNSVVWVVRKP